MLESCQAPIAPGAVPILGHVHRLIRDPLDFIEGLQEIGPVVRLRLGPRDAYVLTRSDLVRRMLTTDLRYFERAGTVFDTGREVLGNGLATCTNVDHRWQRPLVQPAFHPTRLAGYGPTIQRCVSEVLDSWQPGCVVDLIPEMNRLAALVVSRTLISSPEAADAANRIARKLPVVLNGVFRRMVVPVPLLHKVPTSTNRRYVRDRDLMWAAIERVVAQYRSVGGDQQDLLSMIMAAGSDGDGPGFSDALTRDQIMTMLFAATETTAVLMASSLQMVMDDPEVERRLRTEVDEVAHGDPPRFEDLARLPYTARVLTETLRLHSPIWMLSRSTTDDVDMAGYRIPAGVDVLYSPYALNRDPELFPDPHRFDPDRWLPSRVTSAQRSGTFGFGGGRRQCIGANFAMIEATMTLATAISRWRLRSATGKRVTKVARATVHFTPSTIVVEPRTDSTWR
jgi:cytochrome P450